MDKNLLRKKCNILLESLVGVELIERWWKSHNKAFNKTPEQEFDTDPVSVYNYLIKHLHGEW